MPDSFEKIEKNVPELHLVAIFCEKKSETVTKQGNSVKNYPFSAGNTQTGGLGGKKQNFRIFTSLGAFQPPISGKLFLASPIF